MTNHLDTLKRAPAFLRSITNSAAVADIADAIEWALSRFPASPEPTDPDPHNPSPGECIWILSQWAMMSTAQINKAISWAIPILSAWMMTIDLESVLTPGECLQVLEVREAMARLPDPCQPDDEASILRLGTALQWALPILRFAMSRNLPPLGPETPTSREDTFRFRITANEEEPGEVYYQAQKAMAEGKVPHPDDVKRIAKVMAENEHRRATNLFVNLSASATLRRLKKTISEWEAQSWGEADRCQAGTNYTERAAIEATLLHRLLWLFPNTDRDSNSPSS